jgi:hypothetical protein
MTIADLVDLIIRRETTFWLVGFATVATIFCILRDAFRNKDTNAHRFD